MASEIRSWTRQGEAFWRAHREAWKPQRLKKTARAVGCCGERHSHG